jgi:drug/metabolite transporter (DMT)-like permease
VVAPFALRGGRTRLRLASFGAAAGDAVAAVALKLTADAAALDRWGLAVVAVAGALATGSLALTAEMSALRKIPATQVAPVVLAAQVIVPAIAAIAAFGEPLTAPVVLGVVAAGAGAALLGASGGIAKLRAGRETEPVADDRGGARQRAERVVR